MLMVCIADITNSFGQEDYTQNKVMMTNGWQTVQLGDVLRRVKSELTIDDLVTYKQVTVRLWNKGVILRGEQEGADIKTKRQFYVKTGQLLMSRIDVRNGAIGLVPKELDGAIISNDFWVYDFDERQIYPDFLALYVKTPGFIEDANRTSSGTTKRIRAEETAFLNINIPLPPLTEQRRIVAHVESLAARVNEAQRLREEVEESISAFVASYHSHNSDKAVKLGGILTLDEDKEIIKPEGSYPQIGVKGFGKGLFSRETLLGTQTTYKWFNRLYYGAVVLSQVKGWEGAIGVVDKSLVGKFASPEYRTFRCKPDKALPEYLAELIARPWFYLQLKTLSRGVGGRRERIRPELFVELEITMPDIERQKLAVQV